MIRTAIVTRTDRRQRALIAEVASDAHGATSLFLGTVRDVNDGRAVTGMEYTAYDAMADRASSRRSRLRPRRTSATSSLVVEHRIGTLELGDVSVAIAAAHAHRAPRARRDALS